ncbi:hypothetical protein K432DRAFT_385963 [Lepidopterella palustris CBS 459.81]|uniref:Uncharacterized protein n=1 Tax=Lepidopterella palustris CBS 459.81 TaxID=1314670 RepID=A0A8E2E1S5_9PEZI|nr:hypothetical protein K432DRAFT_385963 [Lepidopterella palustris CBS 459.81]
MPPRKKACFTKDPDTVYSSGVILRQKRFPPRRKTKVIRSSPPPSTERQQTMTQVGYLSIMPSPSEKKKKRVEVQDSESESDSEFGEGSSDGKRQQTLTQMTYGIQPLPGNEGDKWKAPTKRKRRELTDEEKRQQTLTQMCGTMPTRIIPAYEREHRLRSDDKDEDEDEYEDEYEDEDEDEEDEDEDEEEEDNGYGLGTKQHLAEHGLHRPETGTKTRSSILRRENTVAPHVRQPMADQESIDPVAVLNAAGAVKVKMENPTTPRRQRVLEVPSSQSPAESPLSTQRSIQRYTRSPLRERSSNAGALLESPSKSRQVTFSDSAIKKSISQVDGRDRKENTSPVQPCSLQKLFKRIIDDSDEDDGSEDEIDGTSHTSIGEETQAIIRQIDQACVDHSVASSQQELEEIGRSRPEFPLLGAQSPSQLFDESDERLDLQPSLTLPIKQETLSANDSQDTTGTGSEDAAAQLVTCTQRQSRHRTPTPEIPGNRQINYQISDYNNIPTQSSHPSQATTVTGSQLSPPKPQQPVNSQNISPKRPAPLTIPSSLPSIASSPLAPRNYYGGDTPRTSVTRDDIITATQMLPESFVDFSIPPPPPWDDDYDDDDDEL